MLFSLVVVVLGGVIALLAFNGTGTFTFFTAKVPPVSNASQNKANAPSTNSVAPEPPAPPPSNAPQTRVRRDQPSIAAHRDLDNKGLCVQYTADEQFMNLLGGTTTTCPTGPLTPPPYNYQVLYDTCDYIPNQTKPPYCSCRGSVPTLDLDPYCTVI